MSPPNNTNEIPANVSADSACRNAKENSYQQNALIEHDQALARVMNGVLRDDMQLYEEFKDAKERGLVAGCQGRCSSSLTGSRIHRIRRRARADDDFSHRWFCIRDCAAMVNVE